eukprot:1161331-Pelagomonas_calceolata.AAC.5
MTQTRAHPSATVSRNLWTSMCAIPVAADAQTWSQQRHAVHGSARAQSLGAHRAPFQALIPVPRAAGGAPSQDLCTKATLLQPRLQASRSCSSCCTAAAS